MNYDKEHNRGWGCDCTNWHACEYHIRNSFYKGSKDVGTLPIEYSTLEQAREALKQKKDLW